MSDEAEQLARMLATLPPDKLAYLRWQQQWILTARPEQIPPEKDWNEYGCLAGRGWGKTKTGAEWLGRASYDDPQALPACVVAPTQQDARHVCFEGVSGLLNVIPPECVTDYNRTDITLTLSNGATIRGFSAERADRLRGPQHARAWCDELAAWGKDAEETWDMLELGMRLGDMPRTMWTTTPKPVPLVRKLVEPRDLRIIITGSTFDNVDNLPESFFDKLAQYEGTKIGRQELYGELIDLEESGIVKRSDFQLWPADRDMPAFDVIIMSLDTAYTEKTVDKKGDPDPSACQVWGVFRYKDMSHAMLLDAWQEHLGFPDLLRKVKKEIKNRYGASESDRAVIKPLIGSSLPLTAGRKPDMILIEDKGSGISLRQALAAANIITHPYNPGRASKLARLHVVSPIFASRRVWLPESPSHAGRPRTWCEPVLDQLCAFSGEGSIKHDDHVDACTQTFKLLMDKNFLPIIKTTRPRDYDPDAARDQPARGNPYAA